MNDPDFLDAVEFGNLSDAKMYSEDGRAIEVNGILQPEVFWVVIRMKVA